MKIPHNIRKISKSKLAVISQSNDDNFVVYVQKAFAKEDIRHKKFFSLGISEHEGEINFPLCFLPSKNIGRFCKYNQTVREVIHKELGKKSAVHYFEVPNFGDYSLGTHEVSIPYEYYPREYIQPTFTEITIEKIKETNENIILRFVSTEILSKQKADFDYRLFANANIFQELFGDFEIKESSVPYPEYRKQISIDWEILPEGERKNKIIAFISQNSHTTNVQQQELLERFDFLESLHPIATITGTSGFNRYIGYQLKENLVIFENLRYGNAIYVMYDNWENLSKRTRLELLSGYSKTEFDRIVHDKRWKNRLKIVLKYKGF